MCVLIALAVCNGPLLYDYTLIYKGSLNGTVLVIIIRGQCYKKYCGNLAWYLLFIGYFCFDKV